MARSCTQKKTVILCLPLQNWKNSNVTKIYWCKVESCYIQTPTEIMMSVTKTNESTHNWAITERINCDDLLFTTTCQSPSTDRPFFLSQLQWQSVTR